MNKIKNSIFNFLCLLVPLAVSAQNGLDFDGVDDYVQTDYSGISGSNARTIEAWIKSDDVAGQTVITDWGTFATGARFTVALIDGKLRTEVSGSGYTGATVLSDTTWHHVAVTYDNSLTTNKYSMYVDGLLEQSFDLATSVNTGSAVDMRIGIRIDGVKPFMGTIDEVRVWNYARSLSEISTNMNSEFCGATTGLVAYHKLNSGTASGTNTTVTTSNDDSGSSNDGSLLNFSLSGSSSNWVTGQSLTLSTVTINQSINECTGYSITVGNNTYNSTGVYTDTIVTTGGCDSIMVTSLVINTPSVGSQTIVECEGYALTIGNNTYTTTGVYIDTAFGGDANGCDMIMTTNLTINEFTEIAQDLFICDGESVTVGENTYTSNGVFTDTLSNLNGCDTVFTSTVAVNSAQENFQVLSGCIGFSVTVDGNVYTETGDYTDIIEGGASNGCDSIIETSLTIVSTIDTSLIVSGSALSVTYLGANYQWLNCDSNYAEISGEINSVFVPSQDGNYAVEITDGNCIDTSSCYAVFGIGLGEVGSAALSVVTPNPIIDKVTIELANHFDRSSVTVVDITGKVILEFQDVEKLIEVDMNSLNMGIYFIQIQDVNHEQVLKVLKL